MGLYVSRAILRHYGGELKYEPQAAGACFTVELEAAEACDDPVSAATSATVGSRNTRLGKSENVDNFVAAV